MQPQLPAPRAVPQKAGEDSGHTTRHHALEALRPIGSNESPEHWRDDGTTVDPPYVNATHRAINPEYLVVRGVCTHLGCVPQKRAEEGKATVGEWWTGGFICPCHQSGFDYSGRVVRGPAPRDLPIPPHRYVDDTRLIIGEPTQLT